MTHTNDNISITQSCTDWGSIMMACKVLACTPFDFFLMTLGRGHETMESIILKINAAVPDGNPAETSATVLLCSREIDFLVRLILWFENELEFQAPVLSRISTEGFRTKVAQIATIKLRLERYRYATHYPNN